MRGSGPGSRDGTRRRCITVQRHARCLNAPCRASPCDPGQSSSAIGTGDTGSVEVEQAGFGFFVRGAVAEGDSAQIDVVVSAPGGYSSEETTIRFVADGLWAPGSAVELFRNLLYSSNYPISSYFSELERQYLDQQGNMNGRYDLGDARKWLLENR